MTEETETKINDYRIATEALILVHEKSMSEAAKDTDDTDANDTKDTKDTDAEDKQVW